MFSFWSRSAAVSANEAEETHSKSDGSASPPPPSTVTEQTPVPTAPKPRKPRKSTKKSPLANETTADASGVVQANGAASKAKAGTANLEELRELVTSVPPKTLHMFVMERLDAHKSSGKAKKRPNANVFPTLQNDFPILAGFFNGLEAPPKRHCLRCHTDYVDIENGPRSCVKEHDDDSAVVRKSVHGIHYTFWGCCGQTVDGDGDQGPPTGWCYEGPHTTDKEEARYRQDGTEEDDKLGDCKKLHCGQIPKKRKRASSVDSDSGDDTPVNVLEPRERHARRKSEGGRGRSKSRLRDLPVSDDDVEMAEAATEKPKPRGRPKKSDVAEEKEEEPEEKAKGKKSAGGRGRAKKDDKEEEAKAVKKKVEEVEEAKKPAKRGAKKRKTED